MIRESLQYPKCMAVFHLCMERQECQNSSVRDNFQVRCLFIDIALVISLSSSGVQGCFFCFCFFVFYNDLMLLSLIKSRKTFISWPSQTPFECPLWPCLCLDLDIGLKHDKKKSIKKHNWHHNLFKKPISTIVFHIMSLSVEQLFNLRQDSVKTFLWY